MENIHVPVYQVAGPAQFSSMNFPFLAQDNKWLRFAPSYHVDDFYTDSSHATELLFFDHYLKGIDNGWERDTPHVKVETSVAGLPGSPVVKVRTASSWPIENTVYKKLYLDVPSGTLADAVPAAEGVNQYDSATGKATFTYTFPADADVTGFLKVKLWVKADSIQKDMDLFVNAYRDDAVPATPPAPVLVGSGQVRASMRELDATRSTDWYPVQSLRTEKYLMRDEVVPVEFTLRATSLLFKAGDKLRLEIGGNVMALPGTELFNAGNHAILSGGTRDSFLQIPIAPN
jgi:hypothetical protein